MTPDPRPTPTPAACEHPDSRIVWGGDWIGPADRDRYRVAVEQCAECGAKLHASTLWESEVLR
jgi:hypothetical protein